MKQKNNISQNFLPTSPAEVQARGWDGVDIVLVTGDAYVDHPSFGVALIGRWLEANGYRVAILAQPRHQNALDFTMFGKPRLFFGITAGNLDSIVANYSGNARIRETDSFSPGGDPYFKGDRNRQNRRRPDRATIVYANLARAAYQDVPVILGGVEASLRRFVHFDYQQEKLRSSVLTDAKADLLVYGMGERAVLAIARRLEQGQDLTAIPGTCERLTDKQFAELSSAATPTLLPSLKEISLDKQLFMTAELTVDKHARNLSKAILAQKQQAHWVVQNKPEPPLTTTELDALYDLPFTRQPHPTTGQVPAYEMIRDSVTIVRGCCGNCSFCAITRHQGPLVTSRSRISVLKEVETISRQPNFHGTISDLGGPTANLFATSCANTGPCTRHDCLYPKLCRHLHIDEQEFLVLLDEVQRIPGVKKVFISSGLRMELLLRTPRLLERLIGHHTPGALKIAPEHTEPEVLRLMHKPGPEVLRDFLVLCRKIAGMQTKKILFTPYLISSHPGCTLKHMEKMAAALRALDLKARQFQDFTPTPGTLATAMYVTGLDRDTGRSIPVTRNRQERRLQRLALEDTMSAESYSKKKRPTGQAKSRRARR